MVSLRTGVREELVVPEKEPAFGPLRSRTWNWWPCRWKGWRLEWRLLMTISITWPDSRMKGLVLP